VVVVRPSDKQTASAEVCDGLDSNTISSTSSDEVEGDPSVTDTAGSCEKNLQSK
jgi:hypothetical protein